MSDGFSGSNTKSINGLTREVESRLRRLDYFKDEFSPPGTGEQAPGLDFDKPVLDNARFDVKQTDPTVVDTQAIKSPELLQNIIEERIRRKSGS